MVKNNSALEVSDLQRKELRHVLLEGKVKETHRPVLIASDKAEQIHLRVKLAIEIFGCHHRLLDARVHEEFVQKVLSVLPRILVSNPFDWLLALLLFIIHIFPSLFTHSFYIFVLHFVLGHVRNLNDRIRILYLSGNRIEHFHDVVELMVG